MVVNTKVTAALGMGIGGGYEWISVLGCIIILTVLFLFSKFEIWIDRVNQLRNYRISCDFKQDTMQRFEKNFERHHLRFQRGREIKDGHKIWGEWFVRGSLKNHQAFITETLNDPEVTRFEY